ncbi:MalY/PatB family protein [Streptomyces sp. NPDC060235]|uniref:MalY/PatB family protein n=1 Tax=Streptomyces sp. NPDC060235 TaxID=3347080 RepID=UPI00365C59BF
MNTQSTNHAALTGFDTITADALRAVGHLKWTINGPDKLGACAAEADYGLAPVIGAALTAAIARGSVGYLPPSVEADLREACAAWQKDSHGWDIAPSDVQLLPDVVRAYHIAIQHFSRPGSPVIVPVPAFMPFLTIPQLLGRDVLPVPMTHAGGYYTYDLEALDRAFAAGGHLLLLCNPHNPTGRVLQRHELVAISKVVEQHGGRVFSDEVHAPLVYFGHQHIPYATLSSATAAHTLTATSASKAWNLAGLKCAQMLLSNEADRDHWQTLGRLATDGTSILGVVAGIAAFREGQPWLNEVLAYLNGNRHLLQELLAEHLPRAAYTPPEGTYLGWVDLRATQLPENLGLEDFFATHAGVTTVDGAHCGAPGRGFVRLNFATTRELLARIVSRMAETVRGYRASPEI